MEDITYDRLGTYGANEKDQDCQQQHVLDRLKKLVTLGVAGKTRPQGQPPVSKADASRILTPEKITQIVKKELTNFDVIDLTNKAVLIPSTMPLTPDAIELLTQLSKVFPSAVYIRQSSSEESQGHYEYPSGL